MSVKEATGDELNQRRDYTHQCPNFNSSLNVIEVRACMSNLIPYKSVMYLINPCHDPSETMLVEGRQKFALFRSQQNQQ